MKCILRYFSLWQRLTLNSFGVWLSSLFAATLFVLGKLLRFIFFFVFLFALFFRVQTIAEYTFLQAIFFYLTFNLVDTTTQLFFREVYQFRRLVVSGDFDLVLTKPMSPLFRALVGGADPLDLIMLVPYIGFLIFVASNVKEFSLIHGALYFLFLINAFIIATGFHILILSLAIVTTEIDHAIMIYRDLTSMGRVPVDIYQEPLRSLITFVVPVGIMMTFPAKAFLGLLSVDWAIIALILSVLFFILCLRVWRFALTKYSSASS